MDSTKCLDRPFSSLPDVSPRLHNDSPECDSCLTPQMGANGSRLGAPSRVRVQRRQPRRPPVAERDPSSHAPRACLRPAGRAQGSRMPLVPGGSDRPEGRPSSGQAGRGRGRGYPRDAVLSIERAGNLGFSFHFAMDSLRSGSSLAVADESSPALMSARTPTPLRKVQMQPWPSS